MNLHKEENQQFRLYVNESSNLVIQVIKNSFILTWIRLVRPSDINTIYFVILIMTNIIARNRIAPCWLPGSPLASTYTLSAHFQLNSLELSPPLCISPRYLNSQKKRILHTSVGTSPLFQNEFPCPLFLINLSTPLLHCSKIRQKLIWVQHGSRYQPSAFCCIFAFARIIPQLPYQTEAMEDCASQSISERCEIYFWWHS